MSDGRRQLSAEVIVLGVLGTLLVGAGAFICVSAFHARHAGGAVVAARTFETLPPALPPLLAAPETDDSAEPSQEDLSPSAPNAASPFAKHVTTLEPMRPLAPRVSTPVAPREKPLFPSVPLTTDLAPMPARRPIELNVALAAATPSKRPDAAPPRSERLDVTPPGVSQLPSQYDKFTAVYDLTAHTVYMPDGSHLEAHSGLGDLIDDPSHVEEKDRGATPPHLYDLTLRESLTANRIRGRPVEALRPQFENHRRRSRRACSPAACRPRARSNLRR